MNLINGLSMQLCQARLKSQTLQVDSQITMLFLITEPVKTPWPKELFEDINGLV